MSEQALKPDRQPVSGAFELTVRCNLRCKMCLFRHDDSENPDLVMREKTADEWLGMARQAAEAGTLDLTITGGEPLLRKDFTQIWEGLSRIGFILTLYTNATLVTAELMTLFHRYPPHRIGVTLYGASEETCQRVTGSGKAYLQAIDGIKMLSSLPSLLDFRTTIIKDNLTDMDEMEVWIKQNYGEDRVLTHTKMVLRPVRGGCSEAAECRLDPEENIHLYLRRHLRQIRDIVGSDQYDAGSVRMKIDKKEPFRTIQHRLTLYGCDAGMKAFAITWDGKLLGCQAMDHAYTEPFAEGFLGAWRRFPVAVYPAVVDEKCLSCDNAGYCLSCCATRYVETGNPGGCSDWICENTKELMKFFDRHKEDNHETSLLETDCFF